MVRRLWTRDEQVRALELYLRTSFGKIHARNPEIIALAANIGRTTNALALKMVNFAALDPTIPQKGMGNYSKADEEIWSEFFVAPSSFLSSIIDSQISGTFDGEYTYEKKPQKLFELREGTEVERTVRARANQNYFREMLLASYDGKCALTGISKPELLIASHIKPWRDDVEARLDPRNGILLNSLHDRAFDSGLITFDDDLNLIPSGELELPEMARSFFEEKKLYKPSRFAPHPSFLSYHRDYIFRN